MSSGRRRAAFARVEVDAERDVADVGEAVADVADVLAEAHRLVDHDHPRDGWRRVRRTGQVAVDRVPPAPAYVELFAADPRGSRDRAGYALRARLDLDCFGILALRWPSMVARRPVNRPLDGAQGAYPAHLLLRREGPRLGASSSRILRRARLRVSDSSCSQPRQLGGAVAHELELAVDVAERLVEQLAAARRVDVLAAQLRAHLGARLLGA